MAGPVGFPRLPPYCLLSPSFDRNTTAPVSMAPQHCSHSRTSLAALLIMHLHKNLQMLLIACRTESNCTMYLGDLHGKLWTLSHLAPKLWTPTLRPSFELPPCAQALDSHLAPKLWTPTLRPPHPCPSLSGFPVNSATLY